MPVLEKLSPKNVMGFFEELSAIPHGSGNTKAISDYCVRFAQARGLQYQQDEVNNVVIIKEATQGYEDDPAVILQGHLDMVCEKDPGCSIDMETEGLRLATDGQWIWAEGTTLGGDDGIAVAMALALLDSNDLPHPRLEVVLTVDEEIGLLGAAALQTDLLQGRLMINVDSEVEGILTISCAGGVRANCHVPVEWDLTAGMLCRLSITGLTGGHSGIKIINGSANANVLMGRLLYGLSHEMALRLVSLSGGMADNAIAAACEATVMISEEEVERFRGLTASYAEVFRSEFRATDPNMQIECVVDDPAEVQTLTLAATARVTSVMMLLPNGVQTMSAHIPGLVQTSLNMGIARLQEHAAVISFSVRSSIATEKALLCNKIDCLSTVLGGETTYSGDYPGWAYNPDSKLRDLVADVYEKQTGKKAVIEAIHAGLECGIFAGKLPGLDCVSIGPDMENIHSPRERLNVASAERTWNLICEVLARAKEL
ncbi:MAG: aminoacyl-histidine dipeptidase [Oscillospiraceae bacterium]|nr:aminoacyl-histidine dipeptidase [Oscillospiraceae bacterium]